MRIVIVGLLLILTGCASQKVETPEMKRMAEKIKQKVAEKDLEIFVNAANPLSNQEIARLGLLPAGSTANRILLNGDEYFKFKGDSLSVYLPYFGTQQLPAEYNKANQGIQFELPYESYKQDYNEKKKVHTLKVRLKSNREFLTVIVKLFRNRKATVYVNSSHRTAINYDGYVKLE